MIDYHVHIGQFESEYFYPHIVIEALYHCGIKGAYISSTTSCIPWDNSKEKSEILKHIRDEVVEVYEIADELCFDARVLCWVIPRRYEEGDSVAEMYSECNYFGFKIHPRAHEWDVTNPIICKLFDEICDIAENNNVPIYIHTGLCEFEYPNKFEKWFRERENVLFVLAHCKEPDETAKVINKYENVYCDVAFNDTVTYEKLLKSNLQNKVLFGTDFPVICNEIFTGQLEISEIINSYRNIINKWYQYISGMGNIKS